ncbi:MAG: hypothetical protein JSV56_11865 [Methanomassiliicoccales archaeon]|nr:MAG: hypothetical protein JSV56_11865 [Methanomassiliicoccales archaeon]
MAEFDATFKRVKEEINRIRQDDPEIQNALDRYHGRSFVLTVNGDGIYVFHISGGGIEYDLNPSSIPNDMHAKMDIGTARKLVKTQTLGIFDIPRIEYRNIGLNDIQFVRQLFSRKRI